MDDQNKEGRPHVHSTDVDVSILVEQHLKALQPGSSGFQEALVSASTLGVHIGDRSQSKPIEVQVAASTLGVHTQPVDDRPPQAPSLSQINPTIFATKVEPEKELVPAPPDYWAAAFGGNPK
ncbi:MAG: hypothetical protein ACRCT2_01830 [Plesiomonas shigelloides]